MIYEYFINLNERGYFYADVRAPSGETVFEIHGLEIFEDGFMNHARDLVSLRVHLVNIGVMTTQDAIDFGQK